MLRGIRKPFEKAGGRRQHGADHEGHHHRKEESLGDIEHRRDGDQQQPDQRDRDHFLAADQWRQFGGALRHRRTGLAVLLLPGFLFGLAMGLVLLFALRSALVIALRSVLVLALSFALGTVFGIALGVAPRLLIFLFGNQTIAGKDTHNDSPLRKHAQSPSRRRALRTKTLPQQRRGVRDGSIAES